MPGASGILSAFIFAGILLVGLPSCVKPLPKDRPYVYILATNPDEVTVVDARENKVIRKFLAGDFLKSIAIAPDGVTAYVTSQVTQQITRINLATARVQRRYAVPGFPSRITIHPTRPLIYILLGKQEDVAADGVSILDIQQGKFTKTIPVAPLLTQLFMSPDGKTLYVYGAKGAKVYFLDTETETLKNSPQVTLPNAPAWSTITPNGKYLLFVFNRTNVLYVVDAVTGEPVRALEAGDAPLYVEPSLDSRYAYVSDLKTRTITVIDLEALSPKGVIYLDAPPVVMRAGKRYLYIGTQTQFLMIADPETMKVVSKVPIGAEPVDIAIRLPEAG
ncbi:MAG: YncE family protein [bacterium JZ-2024 1]